jgi:PAS domain S-box-containing protein
MIHCLTCLEPTLDHVIHFDGLPTPAAVCDLKGAGRTHFVNAAFTEVFGYKSEDVPDLETWARQAYPDPEYRAAALARVWAEVHEHQRTGRIVPSSEYLVVDKWGNTRNVLLGFALHGDHLLITFQDMTQLRTTEAALGKERVKVEEAAYALTENMPGGAYTMVLKPGEDMAQFCFVSTRFLHMLGLERDAVLADPMAGFACVHPDDFAQWVAWNTRAFTKREPFSRETRVVVRGETLWIRAESVPRTLPDGSILWEGVLVDITRLKAMEQRLESVLDAARANIWTFDIQSGEVVFNERWATTNGLPPEQDFGNWLQRVHPDDRQKVRDALESLTRHGSGVET